MECPICIEIIGDKNVMTTECGHTFHARCILTNAMNTENGFSCPCCRFEMATELIESESSEDESETTYSDNETENEIHIQEENDSLRGLRFMMGRIDSENYELPDDFDFEMDYLRENHNCPDFNYIYNNLSKHDIRTKELLAGLLMEIYWKHNVSFSEREKASVIRDLCISKMDNLMIEYYSEVRYSEDEINLSPDADSKTIRQNLPEYMDC